MSTSISGGSGSGGYGGGRNGGGGSTPSTVGEWTWMLCSEGVCVYVFDERRERFPYAFFVGYF